MKKKWYLAVVLLAVVALVGALAGTAVMADNENQYTPISNELKATVTTLPEGEWVSLTWSLDNENFHDAELIVDVGVGQSFDIWVRAESNVDSTIERDL